MRWEQDLVRDIRYFDERDNYDENGPSFAGDIPSYPRIKYIDGVKRDFSALNQSLLQQELMKVKACRCIVEIGVARASDKNFNLTSTSVFFATKPLECVYLGIDLEPKDSILNKTSNVHFIQGRSEDFPAVRNKLKELHCEEIDVLMIDGWHSINQVLLEWEYTDLLSDNGLVVFHDTRQHPGPHLFVKNLNKDKWDVIENACDPANDHGIGFVKRKR